MEKKKNKKRTFSDYVAFIVVIVAIIYLFGIFFVENGCVADTNKLSTSVALLSFAFSLVIYAINYHDQKKANDQNENLIQQLEDLHGEIEELKKQNQEIIKLLKETYQKNDCVISRIAKKIKK